MRGTAALIVGSGGASGFDRGIALAKWGATTVIEHLVRVAFEAGLDPVVVVLGDKGEEVVESTDLGAAVIVLDPEWEEGAAASIRAGLDQISRDDSVTAVALLAVDQPDQSSDVLAHLLAEAETTEASAVVPKYRYAEGLPMVIDRTLWQRMMGMEGDARVASLLKAHPEWVHEVWIDRIPPVVITSFDEFEQAAPRR